METPGAGGGGGGGSGGGMLGRLTEKILGWVALGLIVLAGVALYRMGPGGRTAIWEAIWRTAAWVILAGALPWLGRFFIRRILEIGSNWAGAALIGGFTLLDLVAGLILLSGWPSGGWGWTFALAALALAGTYNYLVTEYLAEQAGG